MLSTRRNFREAFLSLQTKSTQAHFEGEPNVVAHARVDDRTDPVTSGKMLFAQELQSDWGQDIRKHGVRPDDLQEQTDYQAVRYRFQDEMAFRLKPERTDTQLPHSRIWSNRLNHGSRCTRQPA